VRPNRRGEEKRAQSLRPAPPRVPGADDRFRRKRNFLVSSNAEVSTRRTANSLALLTGMSERMVSADLGWDKVKATAPVFAGDTACAESKILDRRQSERRPTQDIGSIETRGFNQVRGRDHDLRVNHARLRALPFSGGGRRRQ
jgi:hypothetical protein